MFPAAPRHNINLSGAELLLALGALFASPRSGDSVARFEKSFAEYIGAGRCFAFASGSASLFHGLSASGLEKGAGIIVPDYQFHSVIDTVRLCGFDPVFAKIDPLDGNLTARSIEQSLTENCRAVLVAHIHGRPAPIEAIKRLCDEKGLLLIEDCAHAAGVSWKGRKVGSFGQMAIFSFGEGKSLTTLGGGMLAVNDEALADRVEKACADLNLPPGSLEFRKIVGALVKAALSSSAGFSLLLYPVLRITQALLSKNPLDAALTSRPGSMQRPPESFHHRMTDFSAQLGRSQLPRLDALNDIRERHAKVLSDALAAAPGCTIFRTREQGESRCLNFAVTTDCADALAQELLKNGIDTRRDYLFRYAPDHPQGRTPAQTLYLPNHPGLSSAQVEKIANLSARIVSEGVAKPTHSPEPK